MFLLVIKLLHLNPINRHRGLAKLEKPLTSNAKWPLYDNTIVEGIFIQTGCHHTINIMYAKALQGYHCVMVLRYSLLTDYQARVTSNNLTSSSSPQ